MHKIRTESKRIIFVTFGIIIFVSVFLSCNTIASETGNNIKVACIGDSITEGTLIPNKNKNSYPSQLGFLLNSGYTVRNFGVSGACVQRHSNKPYSELPEYKRSMEFQPDIVLFMLGSNDSKTFNWHRSEFTSDFEKIISSYRNLSSRPRIIVMTSIPAYSDLYSIQGEVIDNEIVPYIKDFCIKSNIEMIDLNCVFLERLELYSFDKIHLNKNGGRYMAKIIFESIDW